MGDNRRFDILANFISQHVPRHVKIADVAAGKGYMSLALRERGYKNIVAYEPEPRKSTVAGLPLRAIPFSLEEAAKFDVIVGMHPDAATEEIICGAAKYQKQMFLVPCCAKTSRTVFWKEDVVGPRFAFVPSTQTPY